MKLPDDFFAHDASEVAMSLLGKVIRKKYRHNWLSAQIIETEAYYKNEKGSHSSLGYTEKRRAMFMPPGTIYMYYARGGDSLNISCGHDGDAVLIKSAMPFFDELSAQDTLQIMHKLNPLPGGRRRTDTKLLAGQTLLCRAMDIRVSQWNQEHFDQQQFYIDDTGYRPEKIIQTTRLGIPAGRDEHLQYRYIDYAFASNCTRNPLRQHSSQPGIDYQVIEL